MTNALAQQTQFQPIVNMVLDTVSPRTRRDYGRALTDFLTWYGQTQPGSLNKAAVQSYRAELISSGVPASSVNQRLAAIRKLATEAADNGFIDETSAQAICRVENIKRQGKKLGNWLSRDQASAMVNAPDQDTVKGLRDRAVLAIAIGCGLRRDEIATLRTSDFALREARWVILDLEGKHGRVRTVPVAAWVKSIVDSWTSAAALADGDFLFPAVRRGGHIQDGHMTAQAVWKVVETYSPVPGLAPHDLRRTFAKLAHQAGAPIEQIQQSLGHASIQTTERYLGVDLDLQHAPSDYIKLDV